MNEARFYTHNKGVSKALTGFSIFKSPITCSTPDVVVQPPSRVFSPLRFVLGLPRSFFKKGEPNTPF